MGAKRRAQEYELFWWHSWSQFRTIDSLVCTRIGAKRKFKKLAPGLIYLLQHKEVEVERGIVPRKEDNGETKT